MKDQLIIESSPVQGAIFAHSLEQINLFQEREYGNKRSQALGFIYFLDLKSINYISYIQATAEKNGFYL